MTRATDLFVDADTVCRNGELGNDRSGSSNDVQSRVVLPCDGDSTRGEILFHVGDVLRIEQKMSALRITSNRSCEREQ
jgi:hypothetical protein